MNHVGTAAVGCPRGLWYRLFVQSLASRNHVLSFLYYNQSSVAD